jgi:hypothetical protein
MSAEEGRPTVGITHAHFDPDADNEHSANPRALQNASPEGSNTFVAVTNQDRPHDVGQIVTEYDLKDNIVGEYDTHKILDYGGDQQAVISGRESKLQSHPDYPEVDFDCHVVHLFRPTDYPVIEGKDLDSLEERIEAYELNWIAHPTLPEFNAPEEIIEDLLSNYDLNVGLPKMYHPILNKSSRDSDGIMTKMLSKAMEVRYDPDRSMDVYELARDYETAIIPEQDWKSALAPKNQGMAFSSEDIINLLEEDDIGGAANIMKDLKVVGTSRAESPLLMKEEGLTFTDAIRNNPQLNFGILNVEFQKLQKNSVEPLNTVKELQNRAYDPQARQRKLGYAGTVSNQAREIIGKVI